MSGASAGADVDDGSSKETLLQFETAMSDFRTMFPRMSAEQIEDVLRKHDGYVSSSLDELLQLDSPNGGPRRSEAANLQSPARNRNPTTPLTIDDVRVELAIIEQRLRENQRRIDVVCDVAEARQLEDAQLALLLRHRDLQALICRGASSRRPSGALSREDQRLRDAIGALERRRWRRRASETVDEPPVRCPEGPLVDFVAPPPPSPLRSGLAKVQKASRRFFSSHSTD